VLGLLPPRSGEARRLVDAVRRDLGAGPFVHRYPTSVDDGFAGREGAFVPVSWWLVSALALTGRVDDARDVADGLCGQLPRLMPEEWDPARSEALGNTPLLWTHMEAARALALLDRAGGRRFRLPWPGRRRR
jgi:GH15 family glucan-1,4-alpha-glucosidase